MQRSRPFVTVTAVVAVALLIGGCAGRQQAPSDGHGQTREVTVTAANGTVTVPVTTDNVWALDEYAALYLLAVGIVPDHTANVFRAEFATGIAEQAGSTITAPGSLELVASAQPDLIVGLPYSGHKELLPRLEQIAPVVLLPEDVDESLPLAGAITGRDTQAGALLRRLDARFADLAARIRESPHAGATYSVLSGTTDTTVFAHDYTHVFDRLGLVRPPDQPELHGNHADAGYIQVSPELLNEHRADIVIALVDDYYTRGRSVLGDLLFETRASITAEVYYLAWSSPTPISTWWALRDLDAILLGNGRIATPKDAPAIWTEMTGSK